MLNRREQAMGLPWERPRPLHWSAALVALCLSLVFHLAVVHYFPPVPVGRVGRMDEQTRLPPLVLRDVQRGAAAAVERPRRFESPQDVLDSAVWLNADELQELVAELLPPPVMDLGVSMPGDDLAARSPAEVPERELWDVRQDLLTIRDRLVPDEIAALPRRLIPDVDRVAVAPDITAATDTLAMTVADRGADWLQSRSAARAWSGPGREESPGVAAGEGDSGETMSRPAMERSDPAPELAADITDAEAIEDLLALTVRTFRDEAHPGQTYFQLAISRAVADALPVLPRDILLIQDASASMTQGTIDQCKEGLRSWLEQLAPEDRFDVIAFRDDVSRTFGELMPADARNQLRAQAFIEAMQARSGTDVFASLAPLLNIERDPARPLLAVLISDGIPTVGMVSSTEILQNFSEANAGRVSVFSVGGGPQVNEYLLDFLSYKNRGDSLMTWQRDELPTALERLARELRRPVLTDLQYQVAGRTEAEIYPQLLPHLFLDRPLILYGRKPDTLDALVIRILGQSGTNRKDMVFSVSFSESDTGDARIREEWAWQKIYHLIGVHIQTRDPAVLRRIRELAALYGLNVLYGDDRVPMTFQRRFRFHGQQAE